MWWDQKRKVNNFHERALIADSCFKGLPRWWWWYKEPTFQCRRHKICWFDPWVKHLLYFILPLVQIPPNSKGQHHFPPSFPV